MVTVYFILTPPNENPKRYSFPLEAVPRVGEDVTLNISKVLGQKEVGIYRVDRVSWDLESQYAPTCHLALIRNL